MQISRESGSVFNANQQVVMLTAIKAQLDAFAAQFQLNSSLESMRAFVKGKWLLTAFSEELFKIIEGLTADCKSQAIKQCRMCEVDVQQPCLYQLRDGINKNSLHAFITNFIDLPEFGYIRERMSRVAISAAL
jgi:hypothetical protein